MATFLVDNFLCIIEAAAALHFASLAVVSGLRGGAATARGQSNLALGDAVADADDHGAYIALMRNVRNR